MIFEQLMESEERNEIFCPYFLRYHLRRDGQLTIYEIWVPRDKRGRGIGTQLLADLKRKNPKSIFAKCPVDLKANEWYARRGFALEGIEKLKSGRQLNLWRLTLT